jgi:superfamily II RNA helicase
MGTRADERDAQGGSGRTPLIERMPRGGSEPEAVLDAFLDWVDEAGLEPYPAQEEAFLELMAGRHVILATPTGSGKSLVAALLHFKAMCEWQRSFYTSPTKALASEKFFWLCREFGPENVGMLTGDAAINPDAPVVCCTTEILANMALRRGESTPAPYVIMDEFHYYGDRERGTAWQIPLLALPRAQFLLMSATLGDTRWLADRLRERSGREVAQVFSEQRPVPLDFSYRETSLHETVETLLSDGLFPIYIVHFTQREAAEQAQALTSARICTREGRERIHDAIGGFRFDSPYSKDLRRFLSFGIGVHHAGLLPKHRLLVEQLAQQGLLRVICGTDTLGVGVNIPIRTVVFSQLAKFDGEKVAILNPREFRQIAGRAGRRGFDDRGSVVCQAPRQVIERKKGKGGGGGAKKSADSRPGRGPAGRALPTWNEAIFERLIHQPHVPLESSFRLGHGMVVQLLQREGSNQEQTGYRAVIDLIDRSHEPQPRKRRLRVDAAALFRSLRRAGIVEVVADPRTGRRSVRIESDLQFDFSLNHTLSLYLVDALAALDPAAETYPLEVLSLCEAILDNPMPILLAQQDRLRGERIAELKAAGVPYEDRIRELDEVTYPKPSADFIHATFDLFADAHPWIQHDGVHPKSIARDMYERYTDFNQYVRDLGIARVEGRLLRYLGDVYKTLLQNVPDAAKTDEVRDVIAYLRTMLEQVDSSLFDEWERMRFPGAPLKERPSESERLRPDLGRDPRALRARVRAELHLLVRALSRRDYEAALACVQADPAEPWTTARFEAALAPFHAEHGEIVFTPRARLAEFTRMQEVGHRRWEVSQVLLDAKDENFWHVEGMVDLPEDGRSDGPLVRLRWIGD